MKRAILEMSEEFLVHFLKGLQRKNNYCMNIDNPLPEDTRVISIGHSNIGTLRLLLASEEFSDIKVGEMYPILDSPVITIIEQE